jgi:tetratricopeptide (TPR) repeat protein
VRAIRKDTTFALAYVHLARALWAKDGAELEEKQSLRDSMVLLIDKAMQLDPDLPESYALLGMYSLFVKNDFEAGLQNIEKAIRMRPDDQHFLFRKGQVFAHQNDHLQALSIYKEALQKDLSEEYPVLLNFIGWSYICIGEFGLADIFIKKALEHQPDDIGFLNQHARLQMIMGKYQEFLETVNVSLSVRDDNVGLADRAKAYLLLGDYINAEKTYAQFFALPEEKHHNSSHEKSSYAYVLRKLGKEKEARTMIHEAKAWIEANMTDPNYDLAKVYSFLGEPDKAIDHLRQWKPNWGLHAWVERDPLFESIRDRPEFKQLVFDINAEIGKVGAQADERIARGEFPTPGMIR